MSFERGLECLRDSAFAGCESLTQVTLPWGTGAVGRMAFFGCTRLSFVKMPTTTRVSDFAFDGCAPGIRVFGGVYAGRMAANPAGE
ncbi:MAG: leucine-rich repeat protein [Christensenellales bacterium]